MGPVKLMNRSAGEPPRPPACDSRPVHEASLLPNGSATGGSKTQVFEPQQHGEHSFELAVEMDLVAAKPPQLVRVERLTERLLANQRAVGLLPLLSADDLAHHQRGAERDLVALQSLAIR